MNITINSTTVLKPADVGLQANYRVITGHVATRVSGKVPFVGSLERDLIMLLDFQPHVVCCRRPNIDPLLGVMPLQY